MSDPSEEVAEEAKHHAEHSSNKASKVIGLMISILALFLAISEMLGKSAQTQGLILNIQVSDTWNFFQAKTMQLPPDRGEKIDTLNTCFPAMLLGSDAQ